MDTLTRPLRLRAVRRLVFAYGVNALGTWLGEMALALLLLRDTHSAAAVAAVWIVGQFVPSLVTPALVARLEPVGAGRSLPALLAIEAVVFAVLAKALPRCSLALVLALIAFDGAMGLTARALLKASIVATTKPSGLLREANALLSVVFTVCMAMGPFCAGAVVALLSPRTALFADAASFAAAALALGMRAGLPRGRLGEGPVARRLRAALVHVRDRPQLRSLLLGYVLMGVFSAAILPVEVVFVTDTLGAGAGAYGTVLGLWGLGAVAGSAMLPVIRHRPLALLVIGSFGVIAVSYLGMGLAPSVEIVCAFSLLGGMANGVEAFAATTAIQEETGAAYQTPVGGLVEALVAFANGSGFLLGGAIATMISARAVYLVAGLAILAAAATIPLAARARPACV